MRFHVAAWCLTAAALLAVLQLHLLPALLAGLLVFQLTHILAARLPQKLAGGRARLVAVSLIAVLVIALVTAATLGTILFFRSDAGSLPMLMGKMADILEGARDQLPAWLATQVPEDADGVKHVVSEWLRHHAADLQRIGKEALVGFVHVLIGMIIGGMLALQEANTDARAPGPLAQSLAERARRLADAFRRIVFAQVRISLVNTLFTAVYLFIVLPSFGVHLPLGKTLVAVTFIAGLLPVLGNLVSNAVIVIVSLSHSLDAALSSLVFLILIHKLEYFLNARIVGSGIGAKAWELLIAMVVMEAAFGVPGVVAAPIFYAYLKDELKSRGVV
ncbi:MAG: AI-2E family transporter [Betaproteobacteria bacterium]